MSPPPNLATAQEGDLLAVGVNGVATTQPGDRSPENISLTGRDRHVFMGRQPHPHSS